MKRYKGIKIARIAVADRVREIALRLEEEAL